LRPLIESSRAANTDQEVRFWTNSMTSGPSTA
jgi:hypothetical protein